MKVICIKDDWKPKSGHEHVLFRPIFGELYTVIAAEKLYGALWYGLAEAGDDGFRYRAENFVPVSDIDETEREDYKRREADPVKYFTGIVRLLEKNQNR